MSRIPYANRLFGLGVILFTALLAQGCMYSPYQDQIYASKYSTVYFNGFTGTPNAYVEIYVQSWPKGDCAVVGTQTAWEFLGYAYSSDTPTVDWEGNEWYYFHYATVIPGANWCKVPGGVGGTPGGQSYKTHVTGRYWHVGTGGATWIPLATVKEDFINCAQMQGGNGWNVMANCTRGSEYAVAIWAHL